MNKSLVLRAHQLTKRFVDGKLDVPVLRGVDLEVRRGETIAIIGASGCGKSSLLHLLGGLDRASSGTCALMGREWLAMTPAEQGRWRNQHLGFVYQFHHLLPEFSALENVAMPLHIARLRHDVAMACATKVLQDVGLGHRMQHRPSELSGGERQRVALARAFVTAPACVLADEPTGNLDRTTAHAVFEQMLHMRAAMSTAFVLVTHDAALAAQCDKTYRLSQGVLVYA